MITVLEHNPFVIRIRRSAVQPICPRWSYLKDVIYLVLLP